jgi:flagellar basal body-associated protein FliL
MLAIAGFTSELMYSKSTLSTGAQASVKSTKTCSSQSFDELQTIEGKQALKLAAVETVNNILTQETGLGGIEDVLFTNFVMQ